MTRETRRTLIAASAYGVGAVVDAFHEIEDDDERAEAAAWLASYAPGTWQAVALAALIDF